MPETIDALRDGLTRIAKRMYREDDTNGPWPIDGYACATDGHIFCAVPLDACPIDGEAPTRLAGTIQKWLTLHQAAPLVVSAARLREFAEAQVTQAPCTRCQDKHTVTCEECHGVKHHDCECERCGDSHSATCEECDDDGQMACPDCSSRDTRIGTLLDRKLNTVLLRDVLTTLATDERDIAVSIEPLSTRKRQNDTGFMFRPVGDGLAWLALLMPMVDGVESIVTFQP